MKKAVVVLLMVLIGLSSLTVEAKTTLSKGGVTTVAAKKHQKRHKKKQARKHHRKHAKKHAKHKTA